MYDMSFDHSHSDLRSTGRRALWILRIVAALAVLIAGTAGGQLPGAPVLQNAWATPGFVGAVNVGGGTGSSVYAAAFGWAPGAGRLQLSGGLGARTRSGHGSGGAYGIRAAIPLSGPSSDFGFAAFAGVGGGGKDSHTTAGTLTPGQPAPPDSTMSTAQIPVGLAVGWRRAVGATHGFSVFATPSYVFFSGGSKKGGLVRAAAGADVGITASMGVTGGVEFGQTRPAALGGPSGTLFGLGLSYAFGRR